MDNLYQNNNPQGAHDGVLNGQRGKWVPVAPESVPFAVSNDANNPTRDTEGNYYYAQGDNGGAPMANQGAPVSNVMAQPGPTPIAANQINAIPTPSSIVQLPPIVQPIALVPFASQSQPLVQYDPNYREEITKSNLEPIYMAKPYAGLSVLCIVLAIVAAVILCLLACIKVPDTDYTATGLDSIFGVVALFGVAEIGSVYYDRILTVTCPDGSISGLNAIMSLVVPILYALVLICAVIFIIHFLIRLGRRKSPRGLYLFSLLGLIFAVAAIIVMVIAEEMTFAIGAIVVAVLFLILLIVPFFARKGAQIIDYSASKRLYGSEVR